MEQHFSLSWREFQGNLSLGCARLLGSGEFADVTLAVEGELLQAHRLVLSICSPYFQRMFHANPCQHPIVVLKDISYRAMKSLLQFMYNGEVSVRQEDLTSFISTAETLEIKGLTNKLSNQTDSDRSKEIVTTKAAKSNNTTENIIDSDILSNDSDNLNVTANQQISMIHQLNKLTSLKRKCDNFLQSNCNVDPINKDQTVQLEKRTKLREKQILNRHKITNSYQKKISIEKQSKNDVPYSPVDLNKEALVDSKENSNDPKFYNDERNIRDSVNSQGSTYTLDDDKTVDSEFVMVKKENGDEESDCTIEEFPVRNEVISVRNDLTSESQGILSSPSRNDQQGSPCDDGNPRFIMSRKGNRQLVHSNYIHTKYTNNGNKVFWRCIDYYTDAKCKVTLVTVHDDIVEVRYKHNHQYHTEKILKAMSEPSL
ncbi:uncharacterized protein LOC143911262 isoform X2 [Arctopsyche grandis]|uniref:uncharacterized protein LOC143911262 isoform X2 n=1 Tax=Arctopsyche grandis TaxID=121162 RepID=UPI00406D6515